MLSQSDMRNILRHRCEEAGGLVKWAAKHGVSQAHVCEVLKGKKEVGANLAAAMGYERKITFVSCEAGKDDA